jgi:hypothetical protein
MIDLVIPISLFKDGLLDRIVRRGVCSFHCGRRFLVRGLIADRFRNGNFSRIKLTEENQTLFRQSG